jgi:hypothetical protein
VKFTISGAAAVFIIGTALVSGLFMGCTVKDNSGSEADSTSQPATNPDVAANSCDAITFVAQTRIALSQSIDSEVITLSGCSDAKSISINGDGSPQLYKNGTLVTGADTVITGDTLKIQLTSSATESTATQATVSIGSSTTAFSVTTGDFTPDAFSFTSATGQAKSTLITSDAATLAGFDGTLTASVSGAGSPIILVNGVDSGTSASVQAGNAISVKLTSAAADSTARQAVVSIGSTSATFDVTTAASSDTTPPSILTVGSPNSVVYGFSQNIDYTVTFTEPVNVTGTPRISVFISASSYYANYLSGSGTNTLIFRHAVQTTLPLTLNSLTSSSPIDTNGGTIADAAGNSASLTFTPPDTNAAKVVKCPANYLPVNSNAPYSSAAFCVSKYEMKNVGGVATSQPLLAPWVSISRAASISACSILDAAHYSLISNGQWQTIARNIEAVGFNWSSGTVGNAGGISRGHSDNLPAAPLAASADDNVSCANEAAGSCSLTTWSSQRRVFKLSNGLYIWDFAGNAEEWVSNDNSISWGSDANSNMITTSTHTTSGTIGSATGAANVQFGPNGNYSSLSTSPWGGLGHAYINYSSGGISRGGLFSDNTDSGIYAVYLGLAPTLTSSGLGFRCVYNY